MFAEACYNENSLPELHLALEGPVDTKDLKVWDITEHEWRRAIALAIEWMDQDIRVAESMDELMG